MKKICCRAWLGWTWIVALGIAGADFNSLAADEPADWVLHHGRIETVDSERPHADWIAFRGDRIVGLGHGEEFHPLVGPKTRVVDLQGRLAIPGFVESHGHFLGLGQSRMMLDLTQARTWDDIVTQVAGAVKGKKPGEWIIGRGWHQEKWSRPPEGAIEGYPTHEKLSAVAPNNPVMLTHASGHMAIANAYALRLAQISGQTKNPAGGEILRDRQSQPSGVLRETAQGLLGQALAADERRRTAEDHWQEFQQAVDLATADCLAHGVTSFHDAGSEFATIDGLKRLGQAGKLRVRLYVMVRDSNALLAQNLSAYRWIGECDNHLTVRSIKRSIDGALGAHGAWLLSPYEDLPTSVGLNTASIESVEETARLAAEHDFQLCVHAIGDKANRVVLDIYGAQFAKTPGGDRRWRVEHAQHLDPADIPRFGQLGVIASMQGIHCTSDAVFVLQRLGTGRAQQGAYVWRDLMKSGATICNGTDAPVEPIDPIACFEASVTRRLSDRSTFFPEQGMSRLEALRSYTLNGAFAAFEEDIKGSLKPGKLADLAVLSHDIMTCPDDEIRQAKVVATFVGGQLEYRDEALWND
jgi:hypothetical protein